MELTTTDQQLILFTKGHYKDDKHVSLKSLAAYFYDIPLERLKPETVIHMLSETYEKLTKHGFIHGNFVDRIFELFAVNRRRGGDGSRIEPEDVIYYLKCELSNLRVYENGRCLIDIGERDPEIARKIELIHRRAFSNVNKSDDIKETKHGYQ